jgi:hypothetical protein
MVLSLHNLAKEYGVLPSNALVNASTFDLYVLDCYYRYIKYQEDLLEKDPDAVAKSKKLSTQDMKAMLDAAKAKTAERMKK